MSSLPLPIAAFFAGVISFLSPCVLPLVPGYVSLISGAGVEQLQEQNSDLLKKVMLNSIAFIIGFSIVFISLGAISTSVGQLLAMYKARLAVISGVVIIIFGLHLTGIFQIKALLADTRLHQLKGGSTAWGAFVIGFAFAFGWTPCVGPILAVILGFAAAQDSVMKGVLLLASTRSGWPYHFCLLPLGSNGS
jgi:cytochrome c-type biogenesis protein